MAVHPALRAAQELLVDGDLLSAALAVVLGDGPPELLAGLGGCVTPSTGGVAACPGAAEALAAAVVVDGQVVPRRGRRRGCGAYYTPGWLVEHVSALVCAPGCAIVDPACGAGAFLLAAWARGCRDLWGVDRDPVAVLAARRLLVTAGMSPTEAVVRIRPGDALLDATLHGRFEVVVGNPPWGLAYAAPERAALTAAGLLDPGEPSSEAAFLRAARQQLRPGGRVAFVLPESWLSSKRGTPLRRWLLDHLAIEHLEVYRKGVFAAAPDMLPVVLVARAAAGPSQAQICWHGLGAGPTAPQVGWHPAAPASYHLNPAVWREEPDSVFAVGDDPALAALWRRLRRGPRLDQWVSLHDGIYKSRLPLTAVGTPTLSAGRHLRPYWLAPDDELPRIDLTRLSPAEQARQRQPKLLVHALRKPALAQRIVCAADSDGRRAASNNFLLLLPRPACPWSLAALAVLLNSTLLNRWYAGRFIQVNIEGGTLGAAPLPPWSAHRDAALRDAAPSERATAVAASYGLSPAELAALTPATTS